MSRTALLSRINEAWKLRAEGWKYRAMVEPVGVQERQLGHYLNSGWVLRRKQFLELSFTEWAQLTPSLQRIHPRYEEYSQWQRGPDRLDPVQQQTLLEKIRDHWANLKRIAHEDLMDLQVFPLDAREIRTWFTWPGESSWPVSQGQVYRDGSGQLSVKLDLQEQAAWNPVQQHLEGHPVLPAIEAWQQATARDIAARLSLLEGLGRYVEAETGLRVWVSDNEGDIRAEGLHNHYIDIFYDQVFRTVVNLGPALAAPVGGPLPLTREQFSLDGEGNWCHYNHLLIRGCPEAAREEALALLLEAHTRLSDIPQAVAAGRAYQEADTHTSHLRTLRSEFLNSGLDPESRCEQCEPWFRALGVPSRGRRGQPGPQGGLPR